MIRLLVGGHEICLTPDHPIFSPTRGWVQAGELVPGDHVLGHDGKTVSIDRIEEDGRLRTVYNLTVSEFHTFFVGGADWGFSVWVHNSELCASMKKLATLVEQKASPAKVAAAQNDVNVLLEKANSVEIAQALAKQPGSRAGVEALLNKDGKDLLAAKILKNVGGEGQLYEVGLAKDLRKNPLPETQVNHTPQTDQAETLIGLWNSKNKTGNEAAIRLSEAEHIAVNNAQANRPRVPASAQELLDQDIEILRKYTSVPEEQIQKLITLARDLHPWDYK